MGKDAKEDDQYGNNQIQIFSYFFGSGYMCAGGEESTKKYIAMIGALPKSAKVLDLGCGCGSASVLIAKTFGCQVLGLDVSEPSLKIAETLAAKEGVSDLCSFRVGDVCAAEFASATFDAVFSRDVLVHFTEENKKIVFEKLARWIKPSGHFVFSDYGIAREDVSEKFQQYAASRGYTFHTIPHYTTLLSGAGFVECKVIDETWSYCRFTYAEMQRATAAKLDFVSHFSESTFTSTLDTFQRKLTMCMEGERLYLVGHARAPSAPHSDAQEHVWNAWQGLQCGPQQHQPLVAPWAVQNEISARVSVVTGTGTGVGSGDGALAITSVKLSSSVRSLKQRESAHGLGPSDVAVIDFAGRSIVSDSNHTAAQASREWQVHAEIYKQRPDVQGIAHIHSKFATAMSCARKSIPAFHYAVGELTGPDSAQIKCATLDSAGEVVEALGSNMVVLIANGGVLAVGNSVSDAVAIAERCEALCELYAKTLALGDGLRAVHLTFEEVLAVKVRDQSYGQVKRV